MRRFAALFDALDRTTRTGDKVAAIAGYLRAAPAADAAWAVHVLSGNRPRRLIPVRRLAEWAMAEADTPPWLFEECYHTVGDLAETIALLLPAPASREDRPLHEWMEQVLLPLAGQPEAAQRAVVVDAWRALGGSERFVWNKLITGGFRVGVSRALVVRAVAAVSGVDAATITHRLTGAWTPTAAAYQSLVARDTADADISRPYPFFLAYPHEGPLETLGSVADWQVEWKWDGIRAQLVRRAGRSWLWSRGEESVAERFPELAEASALLPDGTVLDGEVLPWRDDAPLPFAQLQRRIGRRALGPRILADVPVVLQTYDLLELGGTDLREAPLAERRARLEALLGGLRTAGRLRLSPLVDAPAWDAVRDAHGRARALGAEGLMLKRRDAAYGVGRRRGPWWKWKLAPYTVDAVLVYAQPGHGRRAALHTDYTFAVWHEGALVPFAKAYSGLTDDELRTLDAWIRRHTVEKFGPVRAVEPAHVFEIAFEGIQPSPRHKSGIAVRFPRIHRWRTDKAPAQADTLEALRALMDS